MEFKIKNLGNVRVVGLKERIQTNAEANHNGIPELWQEVTKSGLLMELMGINDGELVGVVGVCANYDEDGSIDYYVGVNTTKDLDNCAVIEIKEAMYAVFECGMANIQETWRDIFAEWLPTSEYQFTGMPSFEYYPDKERCEIYVPIVK